MRYGPAITVGDINILSATTATTSHGQFLLCTLENGG